MTRAGRAAAGRCFAGRDLFAVANCRLYASAPSLSCAAHAARSRGDQGRCLCGAECISRAARSRAGRAAAVRSAVRAAGTRSRARTSSSRSPRPPCPSPALPAASRSIPPSSACSPPLAPALPASGSGAASAGAGTGTPALRADRERGARATACSPGLAAGRRRRSFSSGGTGSTRAFLAADLVNTRSAGAASARDSRACFLLPARSITVLRPCYSPAAEQSSLMAGHCIAWASAEHTLAGHGFSNRAGPIRLDGMI